jgi:transposase
MAKKADELQSGVASQGPKKPNQNQSKVAPQGPTITDKSQSEVAPQGANMTDQLSSGVAPQDPKKPDELQSEGAPRVPKKPDELQSEGAPQPPKKPGKYDWVNEVPEPQPPMSDLAIIASCSHGLMKQSVAAKRLGLSLRQVQRKVHTFRKIGSVTERKPDRKAHNAISEGTKEEILKAVDEQYYDMPPTLITEYLAERQGINISRETLRKMLIETGRWRGRKVEVAHRRARDRRACFGELVQMDSSEHEWLEGLPKSWLINIIDDSTSRSFLRLYDTDSAETNMDCMRHYFMKVGIPLGCYVDKASHFIHTPPRGTDVPQGETQIQRALRELGVELIFARSPQAKGRVERSFQTHQMRLPKALRLHGIKNLADAQTFLDEVYTPRHNGKFSVPPKSQVNVHKSCEGYDLDAILSIQHERTVMNDNTFRFQGKRYQIDLKPTDPDLKRKKIILEERHNGRLAVRLGKTYFKFHLLP